ncbi:MAG TPA: hypothetical protein VGN04_04735 [Herbaspirillum sp.]
MKTGRKVQWFFSKLTGGLIRDPYRRRSARDLLSANKRPVRERAAPSMPATIERAVMPPYATEAIGTIGAIGAPGQGDVVVNVENLPKLSPGDQESFMTDCEVKRKKLTEPIEEMNAAIRQVVHEECDGFSDITDGEFVVVAPGDLAGKVRQVFEDMEVYGPGAIPILDLLQNEALPMIFFSAYFSAGFASPALDDPHLATACKKKMSEAYFRIFEELLEIGGGKKEDASRCKAMFSTVRLNALRQVLEKDGDWVNEKGTALVQQYKHSFLQQMNQRPQSAWNNPLLLRHAHEAVALRPLPGMERSVVDRLNNSMKRLAPSSFLLSKVAVNLVALGKESGAASLIDSVPPLLPARAEWYGLAEKRGQILNDLKKEIHRELGPKADVPGKADGFVRIQMSEEKRESLMEHIGKVLDGNQLEFMLRMDKLGAQNNAQKMLLATHFDMPPFCTSDEAKSVEASHADVADILKRAQTSLSERLIAAAAGKKIGTGEGCVAPGKIGQLLSDGFQAGRKRVLSKLAGNAQGLFNRLKISKQEATYGFQEDFQNALDKIPASPDEINDRLIPAHLATRLRHGLDNGGAYAERIKKMVFPPFDAATRPYLLLTKAALDAIVEIRGELIDRILEGLEAPKPAWRHPKAVEIAHPDPGVGETMPEVLDMREF